MIPDSPCRTCTEREIGCHAKCGRYAIYRAKMDERIAKREQARRDHRHGKAIDTATVRKIYKNAGGKHVNIKSR